MKKKLTVLLFLFFLSAGTSLRHALDFEFNFTPSIGKHFTGDFQDAWANYTQSATVAGSNISYQRLTFLSYSLTLQFDASVSPLLGHFIGVGVIFATALGQAEMSGIYNGTVSYINSLSYYTLAPMLHYRWYPLAKKKGFNFYFGIDVGFSILSNYNFRQQGNSFSNETNYDRPRGFALGLKSGYKFHAWGRLKLFGELSWQAFILSDFSGGERAGSADEYSLKYHENLNGKKVLATIKDGDTAFDSGFVNASDFINMLRLSFGISYALYN